MAKDANDERRLDWAPIRDPAELELLSPGEQLARVLPLLRHGGLDTGERFERLRDNIPGALSELALEWGQSSRLQGRDVSFQEYVAVCLCTKLHALDQEQYPHLYDSHRRYHPETEEMPLEDDALGVSQTTDAPGGVAAGEYWRDSLASVLSGASILAASQPGVFAALDGLEGGKVKTPYLFSRAVGLSSSEANQRPATAAYLAGENLLSYGAPVSLVASYTATAP